MKTNTSYKNNRAFIDGQNLHLGTTQNGWKINYKKFRVYLRDKYHVQEAYYFLGYISEDQQDLYNNLQRAGFIVLFKEHGAGILGNKKGNVDTDVVFEVMKNLLEGDDFDKVVLVSGDGDYKKLVDYLIKKDRFEKILFPDQKFASSLYKKLGNEFFVQLSREDIRMKIGYKIEVKEKGA
jgi:uncharacterized LabA/DUF88 family protein